MQPDKYIKDVMPEIINIRHQIHAHPELSYDEHATADLVYNFLSKYDYALQKHIAATGIVGLLDTYRPGPVIAIRADMDALPVDEVSNSPYASKNKGCMHACGHDGHIANLLCTAVVLSKMKPLLHGKIKLIFQPAEEIGDGALAMIKEGVLRNPRVDYILGLHNWPDLPAGHIGVKDQNISTGIETFDIRITGKGGHSSVMKKCVDPIHAACQLKFDLEAIPKKIKGLTAFDSVAITKFHSGSAYNIIPGDANLSGSCRNISEKARELIIEQIKKICGTIENKYSVKINISFKNSVPATINTSKIAKLIYNTARDSLGKSKVTWLTKTMPFTEDFSYFLQKVSGCLFIIGNGCPQQELHTSSYDFNDNIIFNATKIMVKTILMLLKDKRHS